MLMSQNRGPARLHYLPSTFRVLSSGDHVICAVTKQPIALDALRPWLKWASDAGIDDVWNQATG